MISYVNKNIYTCCCLDGYLEKIINIDVVTVLIRMIIIQREKSNELQKWT